MRNTEYFDLLMAQPVEWLIGSHDEPSRGMLKRHLVLHKLAIRRKSPSAYDVLFRSKRAAA